jgi:membrane-bound lytic murein transglycosylase D
MIRLIHLRRFLLIDSLIVGLLLALSNAGLAQETSFPVPAELTGAVEFWKQIFTRFSSKEVVFFDPLDPDKIYSVLRAPENDEARPIIERERLRIIANYDLNEEDGRIRTQRGAKEMFLSGLKIAGRYVVPMQNIFRAEGLPPDLVYLPLVESSFNVRARSAVGAVGMWQFMPDTGRKFLRIDDAVDERRDPLASTRAAARLLKENHKLFGNWPLAITAYNHGTEGIFRGISAVGSQNLEDLIRRYQSLTFGFASKNFYAEFVAAAEIAKNSEAYFPFLRSLRPIPFHEVAINRPVQVQSVLKPAAISQNDFFDWNPALNPTSKFLPAGYRVKVPPEKLDGFITAQRRLMAAPSVKKAAAVTKEPEARSGSGRTVGTGKTVLKRKGSNRPSAASLSKSRRLADGRTVATEPRIRTPKG